MRDPDNLDYRDKILNTRYIVGLLLAPVFLVLFRYRDFLLGQAKLSFEIFSYIANLLSVPLLLKTFFKPLKSEYREGLVIFSIVMGIAIKLLILAVTIPVLILVAILLLVMSLLVIVLPIIIFWFLIW